MAVLEIARIQARSGKATEVPENLAEGELGFTTDTGEVLIGAPNFQPIQYRRQSPIGGGLYTNGIYPYSNIKILTEFDVSYNIEGNVYYHGPLQQHQVSGTIGIETTVMTLFNTSERNSGIYDYTLIFNNNPNSIKRIGSFRVISDTSNVEIDDQYSEFGVTVPGQTGIVFKTTIQGNDVILRSINPGVGIGTLVISGREWRAAI